MTPQEAKNAATYVNLKESLERRPVEHIVFTLKGVTDEAAVTNPAVCERLREATLAFCIAELAKLGVK